MVRIKRIYEAADDRDGYRILVDRLWPRGLSKETANIDLWMKDIAPTSALRKWYGHDPKKWEGFRKKYLAELESERGVLNQLRDIIKQNEIVTLLYGSKDEAHNQAVVLKDYFKSRRH